MNRRLMHGSLAWNRWHNMFDRERPDTNEIVDVVLANSKVKVVVYNTGWENGFRVYGLNEALNEKPLAWRHRAFIHQISNGNVANVDAELHVDTVA